MSISRTLLLHPDLPLRLDAARDAELHVESGIVWITGGEVVGDLFLAAGDSYCTPCAGRVLVEALRGPAAVRLERAQRRVLPLRFKMSECFRRALQARLSSEWMAP
ncbi:MAG: DUF2917 domain-containing protein [Rhodocyclales bacterium]|nr:DUF2917 domain-containing protein [Rhodocyclales bacterium]